MMKKYISISLIILIIIIATTIGYQLVSAKNIIAETKDIIEIQTNKEIYITPYGYTINNPNIILNPYENSPLTALILFETETELPVTITVHGKDEISTYTNTFETSKKHYLPIYGLYPNTNNNITITAGSETKDITITTTSLPTELLSITTNTTNSLTLNKSDNYLYILDNNNDIRWYLKSSNTNKAIYLDNEHFLLNDSIINQIETSNNLLEIDLLGKVHKQYLINNNYITSYTNTPNSIYVLSNNLIEIDKQTNTITNTNTLDTNYNEVFYNKDTNSLNLTNQIDNLTINLDTQPKEIQTKIQTFYSNTKNYSLNKGLTFDLTEKTPQSKTNIYLIGYKEIDDTYKKYNFNFIKTTNNLQITANLNKTDQVYLILDKFLDKRVYDIDSNHTIINKTSLSGKYSIYIKINKTIYKTNNYIKF